MKILVVDDEALARERLIALVGELDVGEIVGEAANGVEALQAVEKFSPDVVLLDIRMPGMDGLEAAQHLAGLDDPPAVIFTTAYGDHALDAFDAQAVDYLLKPIRRDRLGQGLKRAGVVTRARVAALRDSGKVPKARSHFSAVLRGNIQLVPVAEVQYLKADQKYVTVAWSGGELLIDESLRSLEEEFSDRFLRIHRNALVALEYLKGMEKDTTGEYYITLRGTDDRVAVSRRHASQVRKRLRSMI
ncbi:MAG: LytTR family DNA-binding domain-containing protein [Gammaproteobacteria bacterium]|nr:LytTR family DNA-binding domain-containing protein [Gammaproteobacteria bacterium]MCI0590589.1 LytTR family DNA-binding domain-containing protein [Gammaproteobacteria bacterium]